MGAHPISRRTLLLAGAGAVAGAALRPATSQAARVAGDTGAIELAALGPRPRAVELPPGVGVVGVEQQGQAGGALQARVRLRDGRWSPWAAACSQAHGPEGARGDAAAEPLWVGGARELELRSAAAVHGARLRYVLAGAGSAGARAAAASLPLAQPQLAAASGQPAIIARSAWARGTQLPRAAPLYGEVQLGFVHHTENPNGYGPGEVPEMLRSIYVFHRDVNGWNDIGYNFVVDLFGRIWEARAGGIDEPVVGAHAGGYNLVSMGVAVLGSFSGTPISAVARHALQRLLAWKLALHGAPSQGRIVVRVNPAGASYSKYPARARVSLPRIAGHRDADSTDCPGNALYGELPRVRRAVAGLSGRPVIATLALQAPTAPAPAPVAGSPAASEPGPGAPTTSAAPTESPPASAVPELLVTLTRLDSSPLVGAQVLLQARTVSRRGELVVHKPVGEGTTDGEGHCLLPASFSLGAAKPLWVRALYPGGPAGGGAVSRAVLVDPLEATIRPSAGSSPSG
jgi:hypothetical protein